MREVNRSLMRTELNAAATFAALLIAGAFAMRMLEALAEHRREVRTELIARGAARHLAEDDAARTRSQLRHAHQVLEEQRQLLTEQEALIDNQADELGDVSDACPSCGLDPCDCDEPEAGES